MNSRNLKSSALLMIVAFMLFLSACGNSAKYANEIKQLDSIMLLIDSAEMKFKTVDITQIKQYAQELDSNLNFFNATNKDTITIETATLISEYRTSRKPFSVILSQYNSYAVDLQRSKKQIENLRHDLKKGKVDAAKASFYAKNEAIAAGRVIHEIDNMENLATLYSEKFERYAPKVRELVNTLRANQ